MNMELGSGLGAPCWSSGFRRVTFWMGPVALTTRQVLLREREVSHDWGEVPLDPEFEPADAWLGPEDGLYLRSQPIPPDLPALRRMPRTLRYVMKRYDRHYIDLSGSYDDYLRKFSSKSRQTLHRKQRKFHEAFGLEVREYRTPEELLEFHAMARDISVRTYQEKLYDAGLPTDAVLHGEMRTLAAQDRVRAYLLFAGAKPVSYLYCPDEGGGRLGYRHLGYDPAYAKHSPGTVLQMAVLERLFAERRHRIFDFTEGDGDHKRFFATHSVHCANILFLKRRPRLMALACSHHLLNQTEAAVSRFVERLGLKPRLRRLVRSL